LGELVFAVFAFVALSVVIKACFYIVLAFTLWTFHNHRKYKAKPSYNPFYNTLRNNFWTPSA
jgi:hypothetical protein